MDHLVLIILNMIVLKNSYESKATIGFGLAIQFLHLKSQYKNISIVNFVFLAIVTILVVAYF
jgi:hypothetical protein